MFLMKRNNCASGKMDDKLIDKEDKIIQFAKPTKNGPKVAEKWFSLFLIGILTFFCLTGLWLITDSILVKRKEDNSLVENLIKTVQVQEVVIESWLKSAINHTCEANEDRGNGFSQ